MRLVLVAILSVLSLLPLGLRAAEVQPDIVVILTDDMRTGDWPMLGDTCALLGGEIREGACHSSQATWFPNFVFNTPLCCPFRASFQRGQMAHNTGIKRNRDGANFGCLDGDTIATALHDAGYFTAYAGKYLNSHRGQAPGWDVWQTSTFGLEYYRHGGYITDEITERAVAAIWRAPADQPLFLMVGHRAPHGHAVPARQHAEADVGATINRKDAERKRTLLSVDDSMEAITAAMGSRWADAVVLVTSDNGYLLGEHRTRGKSHWWDEASRCPILLRAPGIRQGLTTA